MSEPSLRDTVADALAGVLDGDVDQEMLDAADAALRVIHSQRDAIAQAIQAADGINGGVAWDDAPEDWQEMYGRMADAVLATLDAEKPE